MAFCMQKNTASMILIRLKFLTVFYYIPDLNPALFGVTRVCAFFMACMVYLLLHMLTGVHCYTETQETQRGDITLDIIKLLPVYMKRMLKVSCCCSVIYCVARCSDARLKDRMPLNVVFGGWSFGR